MRDRSYYSVAEDGIEDGIEGQGRLRNNVNNNNDDDDNNNSSNNSGERDYCERCTCVNAEAGVIDRGTGRVEIGATPRADLVQQAERATCGMCGMCGLWNRNQIVISKPDIVQIPVLPSYEFIVLGTDGIFDVMTDQESVNVVRRSLCLHGDVRVAAAVLVCAAAERGAVDNVSAVVCCLNQVQVEARQDDAEYERDKNSPFIQFTEE